MVNDMRLISVKDGGRFAMSWVAGTNPKALRSNFQRTRIYTVDVPEVCEDMMEIINSKEDRLSFRILYRLCFGTIHIFAEQVQHLYNVTLNFVCFNTFVLKQYSNKRLGSTVTNNVSKRRRLESSDSMDITSLLLESEIFNEYSEEKFSIPNNIGINCEKKQNTSTCIQIQQITIRQISWDNPMPEEEEAFGEATQDDRKMLLSGLGGDLRNVQKSNSRKRKSSFELVDLSSPSKKANGNTNESIDNVRCAPSTCNDRMSPFSVDFSYRPTLEADEKTMDRRDITEEDIFATESDVVSQHRPIEDQMSISKINELPVPENPSRLQRKHRRPQLIIDKLTKLSKPDMEASIDNIWQNCYAYNKKQYIARIVKTEKEDIFKSTTPSRRFQNAKLLISFRNYLKARLKQDHVKNRQLIVHEILGDDYEIYKSEFKLKSMEGCSVKSKKTREPTNRIEEFKNTPHDENQNNMVGQDLNNNCFQPEVYYESRVLEKDVLELKCSLDEIDPYAIKFDFPTKAETQRSEWGKEGILMKLLNAWISEDPNINMRTLIVGANRINAALAFHTLLDLAGQQYIEIVKGKTNSIESIKMGPEMIRKINKQFA